MNDKNALYLGLFLFIILSFSLAFSPYLISESAYSDLLSKGSYLKSIDVQILKYLLLLAGFVSASFLWLSSEKKSLFSISVVLLFLFSPYLMYNMVSGITPGEFLSVPLLSLAFFLLLSNSNRKYAGVLPLLAGLFLLYPYASLDFEKLTLAGFVLPFAFFTIGRFFSTNKITNELLLAVAGILISPVALPLSVVLLSYTLMKEENNFYEEKSTAWLTMLFFAVVYLLLLGGFKDPLSLIAVSASALVIFYLVASLYSFNFKGFSTLFLLLIVAVAGGHQILNFETTFTDAPSKSDISAYSEISSKNYDVTVLSNKDSFIFYTGKKPDLIGPPELLTSLPLTSDYILLSNSKLYSSLAGQPVIFRFLAVSQQQNNVQQAIFINSPYILVAPLSQNGKILSNPELGIISQGGVGRIKDIPFTKVKPLENISLTDPANLILITDGYADSNLVKLLSYEKVYQDEEVKILKVSK